jgi:hypothetical protein
MHASCESLRCLDVSELPRLKPLQSTIFRWSSDGSTFDVMMVADSRVLSVFEPCVVGGVKKWATQTIPIRWTKCHFGGLRPWFNCPTQNCNQRVGKLYWADGSFACRRCLGLGYPSQRQNPGVRAARRAEKIRTRLGKTAGEPFRVKPRGMHWRTYRRLCEQVEDAEATADSWLLKSFGGSA